MIVHVVKIQRNDNVEIMEFDSEYNACQYVAKLQQQGISAVYMGKFDHKKIPAFG